MKMLDLTKKKPLLLEAVINGPIPPWRAISSRKLAQMLGVSLQVLANWRMRESGPLPLPHRKGKGNKTHYCPAEAAAWASGGSMEAWQVNRDWMASRGFETTGEATEESTAWLAKSLDPFLR